MACAEIPSRLAWLVAELAAMRRKLPPASLGELEQAGFVTRTGPPEYRTNFGKTFRLHPILWARPHTLHQLRRLVLYAAQERIPIKPIGALCTWSPAARPDDGGIALLTDRLTGVGDPEVDLLRSEWARPAIRGVAPLEARQVVEARHLVRAAAGTRILDLCRALRQRGLAIKTMGAFGGERLGGAFSTGTHGSSIHFGPMCDSVVSLDMVWQGVPVRLEPDTGPTNPARFQSSPDHRDWILVQDDELFHTARMGYGMTGVAASYLIEVAPLYYLEERREDIGQPALRQAIRDVVNRAPGHAFERALSAEFYYNLYPGRRPGRGIRVERRLIPPLARGDTPRRTLDEWIFRLLRRVRVDPGRGFTALFRLVPRAVPRILEQGLAGLRGIRRGFPDCVYNMGEANYVGTLVQEIAVPAQALDGYLDDCEALARRLFEREGRALTAPIGVRFVLPSRAALAIQQAAVPHGRGVKRVGLWAMVNFTLTIGTPDGSELLRRFHALSRPHGGRSHVGKTCFDGAAEFSRQYDLNRFRVIRDAIDPDGCFLNRWNRSLLDPPLTNRSDSSSTPDGRLACARS
jgi:FAD/FMN-containing dehydrogenase